MARCTAKAKSTGKRCRRSPIAGSNVCRVHGAGAPQVKLAAQARLRAIAEGSGLDVYDRAISRALTKHVAPEDLSIAVRVVRDVLDRSGFPRGMKVENVTAPTPPKPDLSLLNDVELSQFEEATNTIVALYELIEQRQMEQLAALKQSESGPSIDELTL
jgi:hypothetical protein